MSNENSGKPKKKLSNALKYFFGVGDAGFVLMSNIETFYFMTFLTDLAGFGAGNPGLMTSYTLCISLGAIVGAFAMRYIAKQISSRTTMIIAYAGMAVSMFLIYVMYQNPITVIALMTIAHVFYGMAFAASPALYADTVVYATWKTGRDASGWIMGLQNLPLKIGVFMRGVIVSACLVAVGWQSGAVLEGTARQGMTIAFALVPAILCLAGMILLIVGFRITKDKVAQYQAEIDAKMG